MKSFQHAKVTHGIPTQKPKRIPFFDPKYIEPMWVAPIGMTVNINRIIISRYMYEGLFIKLYFLDQWVLKLR